MDDPAAEDLPGLSLEHSRMHDDEDYKHRRLVEVVPLFMNTGDSVEECVAKHSVCESQDHSSGNATLWNVIRRRYVTIRKCSRWQPTAFFMERIHVGNY